MAHAHTPYHVVQMLISILLELDVCRTPAEKEHVLKEHITDETLRDSLSLLNDILGTHVSKNFKTFFAEAENGSLHISYISTLRYLNETISEFAFLYDKQPLERSQTHVTFIYRPITLTKKTKA